MSNQGKFNNFIKKINIDYTKKIVNNLDRLIEAFTIYYGADKRKHIEDAIKDTIFIWYIDNVLDEMHDDLINDSINLRANYTFKILKMLNIPVKNLKILGDFDNLYLKKEGVVLGNGQVVEATVSQVISIIKLLEFLFGNKKIFDFNYNQIPLYNYFNLDNKEKEKIRNILKEFLEEKEIEDKTKEVIKYMDSCKENAFLEKKYFDIEYFYRYKNENLKILPVILRILKLKRYWQLVGSYPAQFLESEKSIYYDFIMSYLKDALAFCLDNGDCSFIVFPIFSVSDKFLIHELNHRVKSNILGHDDSRLLTLSGISLSFGKNCYHKDEGIEEVINDLQARDITEIFHNLGETIFDSERDFGIKIHELYPLLYPLVEKFYQKYKNELKEVGLEGSLNKLFKFIDKNNFYKYASFIQKFYLALLEEKEVFCLSEENLEEALKYIDKLVKEEEKVNFEHFYDIVGYRKNIPLVRARKR